MAYCTSNQRKRLESRIDDIVRKLRLGAKKNVPTELREFAIAAAIFLAHAEVENFFIDVLDGVAAAFSSNSSTTLNLSTKLRAHLICDRFNLGKISEKMVTKVSEQEVFNIVEKWFVSLHLPLMTGAGSMVPIVGSDIYGDYSYPSIKNIERVLRRMGVGDPKGALNAIAKADVISMLESVSSLRTALAHSATLPGVSLGDVVLRLKNLKTFVRAFDRLMYTSAKIATSHSAWKTAVC